MSSYRSITSPNFDDVLTHEDAEHLRATEKADDAFAMALSKAVLRGREKAEPGTFKDTSHHVGALRLTPDPLRSSCGSPSALCAEVGGRARNGVH